jgi:hypothetical protein
MKFGFINSLLLELLELLADFFFVFIFKNEKNSINPANK